MKIDNLKAEIKDIDKELKKHAEIIKLIDGFKKKKASLKKKINLIELAKLPFEKQFLKWLKSSTGNEGDCIPDEEQFPNLRELMDSSDNWNRYETVDVKYDYPFRNWWDAIVEEDGKKLAESENWDYDLIVKAAKEVMNNNLGSFKYDW